jgi:hypothetical protein
VPRSWPLAVNTHHARRFGSFAWLPHSRTVSSSRRNRSGSAITSILVIRSLDREREDQQEPSARRHHQSDRAVNERRRGEARPCRGGERARDDGVDASQHGRLSARDRRRVGAQHDVGVE